MSQLIFILRQSFQIKNVVSHFHHCLSYVLCYISESGNSHVSSSMLAQISLMSMSVNFESSFFCFYSQIITSSITLRLQNVTLLKISDTAFSQACRLESVHRTVGLCVCSPMRLVIIAVCVHLLPGLALCRVNRKTVS